MRISPKLKLLTESKTATENKMENPNEPDYSKWTKGRDQSIKSAIARELVRDVKQSIPDSNPSSWWMLPSDAQEQRHQCQKESTELNSTSDIELTLPSSPLRTFLRQHNQKKKNRSYVMLFFNTISCVQRWSAPTARFSPQGPFCWVIWQDLSSPKSNIWI